MISRTKPLGGILVLALSGFFMCAISFSSRAVQAPAQNSAELAEQTRIELDALQRLIRALRVIHTTLGDELHGIQERYGNVEAADIYQGIDLSTMSGIGRARQRLRNFRLSYHGLAAAQEKRFVAEEELVQQNDLAEPLATELKARLAMNQAGKYAYYRGWFAAARAYDIAVAQFLDLAEDRAGSFQWKGTRLIALDAETATKLRTAQESLAAAERHFNETGRAALDCPEQIQPFMESELFKIGQRMPRHDLT
jgi:hypothetical protein